MKILNWSSHILRDLSWFLNIHQNKENDIVKKEKNLLE